MSQSDDYIIITKSPDPYDESDLTIETTSQEESEDSIRTLERQGITIIHEKQDRPASDPRNQFSQELMDEGGIEIVPSDEEESFL